MARLNEIIESQINNAMEKHLVFDRDDPWDLSPCILREILLELSVINRPVNPRVSDQIDKVLSGVKENIDLTVISENGSLYQLLKRYNNGVLCEKTITEILTENSNLALIRGGLWRGLAESTSWRIQARRQRST